MDETPAKKLNIKEFIERNIIIIILSTVIAGFGAGIGTYKGLLEITNQETIIKNSYVLKKDLVGPILKTEAVREIEYLIDTGQSIGNDEAKNRIWLMQVLAFVHGLHLEKDSEWNGQSMSAIEADIRYALLDPSIEIQAQKVLGILKGFRAALETQVFYP